MKNALTACLIAGLSLASLNHLSAQEDILIADFESETYGDWTTTGEAFGPGPAAGTLQGQMKVSGYEGERLVNSYFEGDGTTGTLTSPAFKIERERLNFLIGGGGHAGKTMMNLLVDGKVVREITGSNTQSGGSEKLTPASWEVGEFRGKRATIQIVDKATGGWGHINVDHIVHSDKAPPKRGYEKAFTINQTYLLVPIENGAKQCKLQLAVDGKPVRRFDTELATSADKVDWWAYFTVDSYNGQSATISIDSSNETGFELIRQGDGIPGSENFGSEELRPQFHFSQQVGWNNDPNGMVYLDGEWHLYFQHNPVGWKWGNMTWGHAVSKDLVRWEQLPNVLFPETMARGACFSGGATIDKLNTAGWKTGDNDVLVAFLTDTGAGEAVAFSNDLGRTFTWFEGNPIVKHKGRDPKVIWYQYDAADTPLDEKAQELGGHWVMAVYDESEEHGKNAAFYTSTNLTQWEVQSHLPGYYECTELYELPVDGDAGNTRWVVFAGDAKYAVGSFDGKTFTPEHEGKHQLHYGKFYASQTFDNSPDGRRIQIGWTRIDMTDHPFNQTFSFPHNLTLRNTGDGVRMFANPVKEIESYRGTKHTVAAQDLVAGNQIGLPVAGRLFDIQATFEIGAATKVGLKIGENHVTYDVAQQKLNGAVLKPVDGRISMRILVDRPILEIWGNDGAVVVTEPVKKAGNVDAIKFFAEGTGAKLLGMEVYELNASWK